MLCTTVYCVQVLLSQIDMVAGSDNFERSISTFDHNFSTNLMDLLNRIMEFSVTNCEHKLINIFYRFAHHFTYEYKEEIRDHVCPGMQCVCM